MFLHAIWGWDFLEFNNIHLKENEEAKKKIKMTKINKII